MQRSAVGRYSAVRIMLRLHAVEQVGSTAPGGAARQVNNLWLTRPSTSTTSRRKERLPVNLTAAVHQLSSFSRSRVFAECIFSCVFLPPNGTVSILDPTNGS